MKRYLFILFLFISYVSHAQIIFEKGYVINKNGDRIDCLIKNKIWLDNPTELEYKLSEGSPVIEGNLNNIKEFGVSNTFKFIRETIKFDKSGISKEEVSKSRKAIYQDETVFLKVLIEGEVSLYHYLEGQISTFFYKQIGNNFQQLIKKKYYTVDKSINENNEYRQQLWNLLKCENLSQSSFTKLSYSGNQIGKKIINYNECKGNNSIIYKENKRSLAELINLNLRAGINQASFETTDIEGSTRIAEFDDETNFRIGLEAELVIPYLGNKWSIFIEPTYQSYTSSTTNEFQTVTVDYQSIEIPFGLRHSFYFGKHSKIFLNAGILIDFSLNSSVTFQTDMETIPFDPSINVFGGIGYSYDNRYIFETRIGSKRDLLPILLNQDANYNALSFIIGYRIF